MARSGLGVGGISPFLSPSKLPLVRPVIERTQKLLDDANAAKLPWFGANLRVFK
jgi:hypothetical protein